ncbi:Na(+)/H(+) antiporter subunit B [Bacillus carboniphilus]|uniref:Na(+)/H(+) antiporter subunit B n=1 Tax=Bacillus carboniphilus TaxID=86663 RepID=A0ABY9JPC7_9BACI|nr:Na(+)/H(+) antiporter subunit B [Bacillus carboniphilus]WLR41257.1 Na(+)/H(+) antiporter subunit B [Bacillus carboniphilus]
MANQKIKTNDVILQTVTQIILFIIIIFSIYLFFAGHNAPGGGFIGGLMTASAIVLLLIAFDIKTVKKIIPINYILLTSIGLMIAVLSGVGSFFYNESFLSHTFDHFHLPLLGETELATATIFDLGVYLVVIGVTMTIIQTIGETE